LLGFLGLDRVEDSRGKREEETRERGREEEEEEAFVFADNEVVVAVVR
jgi:hypothetical protein